nr:PREDICTED: uncharacterized protein LOC107398336 isoform X2 [Tribolium castaneum]|eukprot:XP_015837596.1 PREDICTED: uncharacterized protein LOC107398336 isoform X2 [Tribolium castaneum]
MNELMTYHFEVCDMTIKINQAFSAHLLLIIVRTFVEFFNSLHSIVKEKSHLLVMYDFFWSTCAIFEFIFMLFACKRATETCSRTGRILNLLQTHNNNKLNLLRNVFLLQIRHKHVTFSANSLFSIDNKMFLHLISTSVAYLLIIIQFEKE